ncbi:MAG: 4Fe-4S dicluster domain-containing protein [Candidatus Marinimicrobia bacterium]|nr:4Fe-4S dicluster domain-containing protein [Candidatus Neomarinimicrobiota bacterium]
MGSTAPEMISRQDFLRSFFKSAGSSAARLRPMSPQVLLPPGSQGWSHFIANCDQCYDCVSKCPHEALRVVRDSNPKLEGYPAIYPGLVSCEGCWEQECIKACPTDALSEDLSSAPLQELFIDENLCLAFKGQFCTTCVGRCPHQGTALTLDKDGKPKLDMTHCTACGICINVCPAPQSAIQIKEQELVCP